LRSWGEERAVELGIWGRRRGKDYLLFTPSADRVHCLLRRERPREPSTAPRNNTIKLTTTDPDLSARPSPNNNPKPSWTANFHSSQFICSSQRDAEIQFVGPPTILNSEIVTSSQSFCLRTRGRGVDHPSCVLTLHSPATTTSLDYELKIETTINKVGNRSVFRY